MTVLLIILGIIFYLLIGFVLTRVFDEFQLIEDLDDGLIFCLVMIFFPVVLIGLGIKGVGTVLSNFIINLFR